jgi:hypothetical protein
VVLVGQQAEVMGHRVKTLRLLAVQLLQQLVAVEAVIMAGHRGMAALAAGVVVGHITLLAVQEYQAKDLLVAVEITMQFKPELVVAVVVLAL